MTSHVIAHSSRSTSRPTLWRKLWMALQLRSERNSLRNLTTDQLEDIGVTAAQAQIEANRSIWDAPAHWHTKT